MNFGLNLIWIPGAENVGVRESALRVLQRHRFVLDVTGLVIALSLYAASLYVEGQLQALIVGVATSFVFAAFLDFINASHEYFLNRIRITFFGYELVREKTVFVYPDFVMHEDVKTILASHNQQMLYQRPNSRFAGLTVHRIDIPHAVAANDIRAVLYVADAFESTTSCPNVMVLDSAVIDDCNRSFISFGLSSNDCTHLYANEHSRPLFHIIDDGNGSEYIRLQNGNEYRSDLSRQYGIIVRYSPDPENHPQRRWFLISGLGPVGTTSAGWYLSRYWSKMVRRVPKHSNFVAVVSTGPYTDRAPHLEEILIEEAS